MRVLRPLILVFVQRKDPQREGSQEYDVKGVCVSKSAGRSDDLVTASRSIGFLSLPVCDDSEGSPSCF